jgi:outer membrane immunogenic protein
MRIRVWLAAIGLFVSSSAMAADVPVLRAPAPIFAAPAPILAFFTWTGCYAGGSLGGVWAKKNYSAAAPFAAPPPAVAPSGAIPPVGAPLGGHTADSWMGGVQGGCTYQIGDWVIGLGGDFDFTDASGSHADLFFPALTDRSRTRALGSVAGRVGYSWHRFLLYGKAGVAWERTNYEDVLAFFPPRAAPALLAIALANETRSGWTAGIGVEYAFTDILSGFIEYGYFDFGTRTNTFITPQGLFFGNIDVRETSNVLKAGFNIRFGPMSPVIGKW